MRPDPVTEFVPEEDLVGFLNDVAEVIEDVAVKMPDHGTFVRNLPPSTAGAAAPAQQAAIPPVSFTLRYERGETSG